MRILPGAARAGAASGSSARYPDSVPFKDTPGLRRIAAMAIENRDVVEVRVLPLDVLYIVEGVEVREGQTLRLTRVRAMHLVECGVVELLE
jgi:hypothetical protein